MRANFNGTAKPVLHSYILEAAVPADADMMTHMLAIAHLKGHVQNFLAEKTGVLPSLEIVKPDQDHLYERLNICCTSDIMNGLQKDLGKKIARVTRILSRDEIIEEELKKGNDKDICNSPSKKL